jgi:hypothetical protein
MHHGLIVFRGPLDMLREVFEMRNGTLKALGGSLPVDRLPTDDEEGFRGAICNRGDVSVFLDQSMTLASDVDFITALSARTGAVAAACVGESVSGTFEFTAADARGLRRAYSYCHASHTEPWMYGAPLQCEREHPFDSDLDGEAFMAAFAELGFGDLGSVHEGKWTPCLYDIDWDAPSPEASEASRGRDAFMESHTRKQPLRGVDMSFKPEPTVYKRPNSAPVKKGLLGRFRSLFGG